MNRLRLLLLPFLLAALTPVTRAAPAPAIPPAEKVLATLRPTHPRLLATAEDFNRLEQRVAADPLLQQWREQLRRAALNVLDQPPSRYEIPDGLRLLATSRRVLDRVQLLALIYRLDRDPRFADRAWTELAAAAQFKDWNPRHFLDTAEMTHAFAVGYDWLYDRWTEEQRATLRQAMIEKGLKPAAKVYAEKGWWTRSRYNWNQVCNGGIGIGALALGDVEPELAGRLLHAALESLPLAMAEFAPDGAWPEGPGYWNYAMKYNVAILAALDTALGTDFGLSGILGFAEAGLMPVYALGTSGLNFNHADARTGRIRAPELFWLARRFDRPVYAAYQLRHVEPAPLDLLWADTSAPAAALDALPLDRHFRNTDIVIFHSAWNDPHGLFVGFKAGDNAVGHSHLDLGSFVLDALGERWAVDLGPDDYNLPEYFGNKRWTYYRLRAEGHNTLVLDPGTEPDQSLKAVARITRFKSEPARAFAVADLTPAWPGQARKVERGIALLGRKSVLVQDEIAAAAPRSVWWFLHTPAEIKLADDKRSATLTLGKARLLATLHSPENAGFTVMPAEPLPTSPHPPRQGTNSAIRKLTVHLENVSEVRLAVSLVPLPAGAAPPERPKIESLDQW